MTPRRARPPEPAPRGVRLWLVLLLAAACFWLGRTLAEPGPHADPEASSPRSTLPLLATVTSTVGLCPCPAPRPKRRPRGLARRPVPAKETAPATRPDPTARTARYLKGEVEKLARCAPSSGAPLRVHLEVEVAPSGAVREGRITNLEPVPGPVARCVLKAVRALEPPGFDATEARRFGLTVVL